MGEKEREKEREKWRKKKVRKRKKEWEGDQVMPRWFWCDKGSKTEE